MLAARLGWSASQMSLTLSIDGVRVVKRGTGHGCNTEWCEVYRGRDPWDPEAG